jgi:hypothetical protein
LDDQLRLEFAKLAGDGFPRWLEAMRQIGGCADPIYLVGHTITRDGAGNVTHMFTSRDQPRGTLAVPCQNRRASRCEPCSYLHSGDTYQIIVTGLMGGKGVPEQVGTHPRVFVTLTAPSFGAVHRVTGAASPCRPWRRGVRCPHGLLKSCPRTHTADDPLVGGPICEECYRYDRAVLWNAYAGGLWHRVVVRVRREVAAAGGVTARDLGNHARVSFAKVIEYQSRGNVHIHAVIRADGPAGASEDAPGWLTGGVLADAVRAAAGHVSLPVIAPDGETMWRLVFGAQLDVQPILSGAGDQLSDRAVAAYVAKYVTKGDIPALTWDTRITSSGQIEALPLGRHGRLLMRACWELGESGLYPDRRLREWTHQLGYPGHVTTKSPTYSTTYQALRQARRDFRRELAGVVVESGEQREGSWEFAGKGHNRAESMFARGIAREVMQGRRGGVREPL